MENPEQKIKPVKQHIITALAFLCDAITILVAIGIIGAGIILLYDTVTDFVYLGQPNHTFSHLISDLMLILIIMALLRQVLRLIKQQPFSLEPFLSIGIIASVRGFLIVQIKLSLSEIEWSTGLINMGVYSSIIMAFAICFYVFSKRDSSRKSVNKI